MDFYNPYGEFKCTYIFKPSIQEAGKLGSLGWRPEQVYPNGIVLFVKISRDEAERLGI